MRTLLVGVLSVTLIGCGCPVERHAVLDACTSKPCFYKTAAIPKPTPFKRDRTTAKVVSKNATKTTEAEAKVATPTPPQPSDESDSVLEKAKTKVASEMEDSASVEFEDLNRAIRKDPFGQSIDTICGHVREKRASGAATGKKAFLYLVKEDIAFVDYGFSGSVAAYAYRFVCTSGR